MTDILLSELKSELGVITSYQDDRLEMQLESAKQEALNFMNRTQFGVLCSDDDGFADEEENLQPDVKTAIFTLVRAGYEAAPADAEQLRNVAEMKLMPYRCGLGV